MKKKLILLQFFCFVSILFISVAYAAFNSELKITGDVSVLTDTTAPTCGEWKLRDSNLSYEDASNNNSFINPGTNTTWRNTSLTLSVDCNDNMSGAFGCTRGYYDAKTYNASIKTDDEVITVEIKDAYNNRTTCTLPIGGSNPYLDKQEPTITITKTEANKFTYSATDDVGITGYMVTTTNTKPEINDTKWLSSPSEVTIDNSEAKTYYVWAKDGVNISSQSISTFLLTKTQGTGTSLSLKYENSSGKELSTGYVLSGTKVYVSGSANTGYGSLVLKKDNTSITNQSTQTISAATTISSSASAKEYIATFSSSNLLYGLVDTDWIASPSVARYKIENGIVTFESYRNDGYLMTLGRVYLEANKKYRFSADADGTWGSQVEASLMLDGQYNTYYFMSALSMSNNGYFDFIPTVSGLYHLRLDVNNPGETYHFSNIRIEQIPLTKTLTYNSELGTLPTISRVGYTFNNWWTSEVNGTQISTMTKMPASNTTYYAHWTPNKYYVYYNPGQATGGWDAATYATQERTYPGATTLRTNSMTKSNTTANSYTVTYNQGTADGGWNATTYAVQTSKNTTTYTKDGWTTSSTAYNTKNYADGATYGANSTANLTLYPNFKTSVTNGGVTTKTNSMTKSNSAESNSYTLTFKQGTATSTAPSAITNKKYTSYTANGWTTTSGSTSRTYANNTATGALTGNVTLYPCFTQTVNQKAITLPASATKSNTNLGTVTFNYNGSGAAATISPAYTTYAFNGWYTASSGGTKLGNAGASYTPNASIDVYPQFTGTAHSATFPSPTRTGYTFAGWYDAASGGNKVTSYTGSSNTTLYAHWTVNTYSIGYTLNSGSVSTANPTSYTIETNTITLNNPTRSGYTFAGWTGSNNVSSGLSYTTSSPYTAAARDHVLGNEFNVTAGTTYRVFVTAKRNSGNLNMNGGIWYTAQSSGAAYDGYSGAFTQAEILTGGWARYYKDITVPEGKTKGKFYIQLGQTSESYTTSWSIANCEVVELSKSTTTTIPKGSTGNKAYTANWIANTYTITLNNQSATTAGTTAIYEKYNTGYYTDSVATTQMSTSANGITVPARTGYTFGGYYTATNGGGTQYIDANGKLTSSASVTNFSAAGSLYAKWTPNKYYVYYNQGQATGGWDAATYATQERTYPGATTLRTNSMTKSNTTANSYTVTYNQGTADGGWNATTYAVQTSKNTTTYTKDGWTTSSTAYNTKNYADGATYGANSTANLTLYPNFKTSVTNGGVTTKTNSMTKSNSAESNSYTLTFKQGTATSTAPSAITNKKYTSYTANGWTTTSGSTSRTYANNTATGALTGNVTLYPCFTQTVNQKAITLPASATKSNTNLGTVTFNYNGSGAAATISPAYTTYAFNGWYTASSGGTKLGNASASYTPSASIDVYPQFTSTAHSATFPSPSRTGYQFAGWYTAASGGTKVTSYTGSSNVEYYAHWTPNTYTIVYNKSNTNETGTLPSNQLGTYDTALTLGSNSLSRPNSSDTDSYTLTFKQGTATSAAPSAITNKKYTSYTANGWATSANGTRAYTSGQTNVSNLTSTNNGTVNLYTSWTSTVNQKAITLPAAATKSNTNLGTVTFNYNGSGAANTTSTAYTTYAFNGWYTASSGGTKLGNASASYTPSASIDVYPQFTGTAHSATFPSPSRTGYQFAGWYDTASGGNKVTSYTGSSNTTLYAHWTANKYTVVFNKNASDATGTMSNQTFSYDEQKKLSSNTFTRNDYLFSGWSTSSSDTGVFRDNTEYSKDNTSGTTYAEVKDYTVLPPFSSGYIYQLDYDAKGTGKLYTYFYGTTNYLQVSNVTNSDGFTGTGTDGNNYVNLTSDYKHYSVRFTLGSTGDGNVKKYVLFRLFSGNSASIKNISFNKVSSSSTIYTDAQSVKNLATSGNFNLYALWGSDKYQLTVNPNGGNFNGSTATTYYLQKENTLKVIPKATRTCYTFNGWSKAGAGTLTKYGNPLFNDETFASSNNSMGVYNNLGNGTVTHTKVARSADNPMKNSSYEIQIKTAGTASPGLGGFVQYTHSSANAVFYHVIVAKIPKGYTIQHAENQTGNDRVITWLTSQAGTGKYEVYIYKHKCGSTGTFSSFGHVYISGTAATASSPVTWNVAYANMFNASSTPNNSTQVFTFGKEPTTLTASWTPNVYTITLNNQSATSAGTTAIYEKYATGYYTNSGATTQMTASANKITVPTRTGYTFGGYYTSTNGGGTQYINASGYITSSANKSNFCGAGTLYAKWTVNNYTVKVTPKVDGTTYASGGAYNNGYFTFNVYKAGTLVSSGVNSYSASIPYGTSVRVVAVAHNGFRITANGDVTATVGTSGLTFTPTWTHSTASITYRSAVMGSGAYQSSVTGPALSGTTGQSKTIDQFQVTGFTISNSTTSGSVNWRLHQQDRGDMPSSSSYYVYPGTAVDTGGKRIEGLTMKLTGDAANYFDIYYRVHVQDQGWLNWTSDNAFTGSQGLCKRVEAVKVKVVPKGTNVTLNECGSGETCKDVSVITSDTASNCPVDNGSGGNSGGGGSSSCTKTSYKNYSASVNGPNNAASNCTSYAKSHLHKAYGVKGTYSSSSISYCSSGYCTCTWKEKYTYKSSC